MEENKTGEILCSNCSAKLKFEPGTNSLKCEFCGTVNEIEIDENEVVEEIDFDKYLNEDFEGNENIEVENIVCKSCGAKTTFEPNIVSGACPFCGNNIVIADGSEKNKLIKPKSLLPFKIERKQTSVLFKTWLKKLWWAPSDLKKIATVKDKIKGVYIPFWTYDSKTFTNYKGRRGDNYTTTETYTDSEGKSKTRTVTRTSWTSVSGSVNKDFDDVLVIASNSLPHKYAVKLEPWDLENLVPFNEQYLLGFVAESYQIHLKDGFNVAKEIMNKDIEKLIKRDIGGDKQVIKSYNVKHDDITFKHILLPVWISAYKYKNKVYRILINARTGEVQGERPYSWIKIIAAILVAAAIIAGIIYLIAENN